MTTTTLSAARMLRELARRLESAERAAIKTAVARAALPAGSSRARVTTANARWASCCEERDRQRAAFCAVGLGALAQQVERVVDAETALAKMTQDARLHLQERR